MKKSQKLTRPRPSRDEVGKVKSQKLDGGSQKLDADQVEHIAKLASLDLSEDAIGDDQRWLSETLDYVEILDRLDTRNVKPTAQVTGLENVFRNDEVGKESLGQKEALSNTGSQERGFFKVKKIL